MVVSTAWTTDRINELIAKGANRSDLPSKSGTTGLAGSATSGANAAQRALLKIRQEEEERRKFMERRLGSRAVAEQRTAELKAQAAQQAQAELDRQARMITVSNNSSVLPNYTAQTQRNFSDTTKYKVHGNNNPVSNNKVIPENVFVDPNVTVTGQSTSSTPVSSSIAASENYNTATAMNDFMSANPYSDINAGLANPQQSYFFNKSSAPADNEVKTADLGGDIQHQETDNYTNVGDLPFTNQVPSNTNWAESGVSLGVAGIAAAGIAGLYLLGGRK
jgi:hypothetical protein